MAEENKLLPAFLNSDTGYEKIAPNETPFMKNLGWDTNANGQLATGTGNPTGEGQNQYILTPIRSNKAIPNIDLPSGYNKNVGTFESAITNELYYCNYNENGNHGLYVISGDTMQVSTVIIDPALDFTDDADGFFAEHRVRLRVRYDENKNIVEKYFIATNGKSWQKWINVIAATLTNGFDASLYPYWTLFQPHFDRGELLEYATRPPMYAPIVTKIPNTVADKGTINRLLGTAFEFCYQFIYTDGRATTTSPFSLPLITKKEDFLANPDLIPKKANLKLYAGSCMVERINLFFRKTAIQSDSNIDLTFGDWYLYDGLDKFTNCDANSPQNIGNAYWLRTGAWDGYDYDPIMNTINYVFDNSRLGQIVSQGLFERVQNDIPQLSTAMSDIGDAILLGGNRYGYDNFPCEITNNIDVNYEEVTNDTCVIPTRTIRLYCYAGRDRGNKSSIGATRGIANIWHSQIGYYNGDDTQMKWGGISLNNNTEEGLNIDIEESDLFELNFADKNGFRCYLKGTPYYADCKWYVVKQDFSLVEVNGLIDASSSSDRTFLLNTYNAQNFFVGVFDFTVPAGRYVAALGRHNVENDSDYRSKSTYVLGIADSRGAETSTYSLGAGEGTVIVRTVKPNAIGDLSKEMEIDCTAGNVDVWGSGKDLFYICTPFNGQGQDRNRWSFIEGYLTESDNSSLSVERFPYQLDNNPIGVNGGYTDKNGFFWGYTWGGDNRHTQANILFTPRLNCVASSFTVQVGNYAGWKPNNNAKLADYNSGVVGVNNKIMVYGRITDLTGTIGYSNIGVSIKDGATDYTDDDGNFLLTVHNGFATALSANIFVNAGGNFSISLANCGYLPVFNFNENLVPCGTLTSVNPCTGEAVPQGRYYPTCFRQQIVIQGGELQSLKSNGVYLVGLVGADLAGRVTFVNLLKTIRVESFPERNNTLATRFLWNLLGGLNLDTFTETSDIKYLSFFTTLANNYKKYIQWIGDKIEFIDAGNNITDTPSNASLIKITISSLLENNINQNLSLLSSYQFVKGDRLRVFDNGDGELFDTATYGDVIDVEVLGSNYNQAAVNANLINPQTNTVLSSANTTGQDPTVLYVKYDKSFDKLKNKNGFWIELYTPFQNQERVPYFQIEGFYPVINGEIAEFTGFSNNVPQYNYLTSGTLNFWDTYLINRNISIPTIGNKNLGHFFESPNITDTWGVNAQSGGKPNTVNRDAAQTWYFDDIIKSDDFMTEGRRNELGTFRGENRKNFKGYQRGDIIAAYNIGSNIIFICTKDWFVVDYNYNFLSVNRNGSISVPSLENNVGVPRQKIGDNYGCAYEDTQTIVIHEKFVAWYDARNSAYIMCDYQQAYPISDNAMQSYFFSKSEYVSEWNQGTVKEKRFDVISGIDMENMNIYVTFRPRRNKTQSLLSFVNRRRNVQLDYQETVVYNIESKRWVRFMGCTPEAYGKLRGNISGVEMVSFALGKPYLHLKTPNDSFCTFYGIETEPVMILALNNQPEFVKILQSLALDINGQKMFVDMVYSNTINTFSYIPLNYFKVKENMNYAPTLRNGNTYPPASKDQNFRSMLIDGGRIFGNYFIVRFVGNLKKLSKYFELNAAYSKTEVTGNNTK